jgi:hypothetical protein
MSQSEAQPDPQPELPQSPENPVPEDAGTTGEPSASPSTTNGTPQWLQALIIGAIGLAIAALFISRDVWEYLIWEVCLSLAPILLAILVFQLLRRATWKQFIGAGDSLPIAMVITAVAMRRIFLSEPNIPDFWIAIGIVILLTLGFVYVFANLERRTAMGGQIASTDSITSLSILSIVLTGIAIIYGMIIAGMSGKG